MLFQSPPSQIELYKAEIAKLQHEVWDTHAKDAARFNVVNALWLEASKNVTHLNNVLRRKNRRIKRQKDIIAQLKASSSSQEP